MPPEGFIEWLCRQHSPVEQCVFIDGLVRRLMKASEGRAVMKFLSLDFRVLVQEVRIGDIADGDLRRLIAAADARTLVVEEVRNLDDGAMGAACYVDVELVAVFVARDVVVLDR